MSESIDAICKRAIKGMEENLGHLRHLMSNTRINDDKFPTNTPSQIKDKQPIIETKAIENSAQKDEVKILLKIPEKKKTKKKPVFKYPLGAKQTFSTLKLIQMKTLSLLAASKKEMSSDRVNKCCQDLENLFPGFRAYPAGSRALGLCDDISDLDVFLDIGDMYDGNRFQSSADQTEIVKRTAKYLRNNRNEWVVCICITSARTPIIQVQHKTTKLNCDISFRNGLSDVNTEWIQTMMDYLPVLKPLILLLKCWTWMTYVDGHFRSYCITIMLIFYLQVLKVLPSMATMRALYKGKPRLISGWEVQFSRRPSVFADLSPAPSFIKLLHGFFNYYGNSFKYEKEVVCPLLGRPILRSDFDCNGETLPDEMMCYKNMVSVVTNSERNDSRLNNFLVNHPSKDVFRNQTAICIQDPFDLSHNLSKAVTPKTLDMFKFYCRCQVDAFKDIILNLENTYDDDFWKKETN